MIELNQFDGLYVDIGAPVAINPLEYSLSWVDYPVAGNLPGNGSDTVGSTGPQLLVNGPAGAGVKRFVRTLVLTNDDTDPHAVLIQLGNGGFYFKKVSAVLTPGDQLHYEDHRGFYCLNANGDSRTGGGGGGGATGPAGGVLTGTYPSPDFFRPMDIGYNVRIQSWWAPWQSPIVSFGAYLFDTVDGTNWWAVLIADTNFTFAFADGSQELIAVVQDSFGGHNANFPANTIWPAGGPPSMSSAPGSVDLFLVTTQTLGGTPYHYVTPLFLQGGRDGRVRWQSDSIEHFSASLTALFTLPAGAIITQVRVTINTPFDGSPSVSIGNSIDGAAYYAATSDVDLTAASGTEFVVFPARAAAPAARAVRATYVAGGATVGEAAVLIEWAIPKGF